MSFLIVDMKNRKFQSLAPTSLDLDRILPYKEVLDEALSDPDIFNVAITGSYGSGKSSLLKTYSSFAQGKKFLNISLASFIDNSNDKTNEQLEISILQQIFYRVDPSKIPDSRFKRIINLKERDLVYWSRGLTTLGLSILILWEFKSTDFLFEWFKGHEYLLKSFAFSLLLAGTYLITRRLIRIFGKSLSKFNVGPTTMEFKMESVFNRHLDEILYFFECNPYDVVVFEDIDRFRNNSVFIKLREINTLINSSELVKCKVTFIYAVKDDLFNGANRTKFFDLIIPVISIINASNANEKLRERLSRISKCDRPSDDLIDDVAVFIRDMRMLNNIVNEYIIYREQLFNKLQPNKLFGVVVYKNNDPEDFEKLLQGSGTLYSVIQSKTVLINSLQKEIDEKISALQARKELLNAQRANSRSELVAEYLLVLVRKFPNLSGVLLENGIYYSLSDLIEEKNFEKLRNMKITNYYTYRPDEGSRSVRANISFDLIEKDVDSELTFEERSELIEESHYSFEDIDLQILEYQKKRSDASNLSIKEIVNRIEGESVRELLASNKLLSYLIRNGFIDENYHDYISYFHEGSLTENDYEFLQNLKAGLKSDFDLQLNSLENLVEKRIPKHYFEKKEILNHDLIDYIVSSGIKYHHQFEHLISQFKGEGSAAVDFINSHIERSKDFNSFVKKVCEYWPSFWADFVDKQHMETSPFLYAILTSCEEKVVETLMFGSKLGVIISNNIDIMVDLVVSVETRNLYLSLIGNLGIQFKVLPPKKYTTIQNEFLEELYLEKNYIFSRENIRTILLNYDHRELSNDLLSSRLLTEILSEETSPLYSQVTEHMDEYVKNVFLKDIGISKDDESTFIYVLNLTAREDLIEKIIEKGNFSISDLAEIRKSEVRSIVAAQGKFLVSWKNIETYYGDVLELDSSLLNLLNKSTPGSLCRLTSSEFIDKNKAIELNKLIVQSSEISDEAYGRLVSEEYGFDAVELGLSNLSAGKIEGLIQHGILRLSEENFSFIKKHFPTLVLVLINKFYSRFISSFDLFPLDTEEYDSLLCGLGENNAHQLIKHLDGSEVVVDETMARTILLRLTSYSEELSIEFLTKIFSNTMELEKKMKVIIIQSDFLYNEQVEELLMFSKFKKLLEPKTKMYLNKNDLNLEFASLLNTRKIIKNVLDKGDRIRLIANY